VVAFQGISAEYYQPEGSFVLGLSMKKLLSMLLQHLLNIYPCCSIATLAVAQNMRELYRLVLVDTPLAPYFSECITSEVSSL
jgi:hypothetical protein